MFVLVEGNLRGSKTKHSTEEASTPQKFMDDDSFLDSFQNMFFQQDLRMLNNELGPVPMNIHTNYIDGGHHNSNKGNNDAGDGSAHTMGKESAIDKRIVNGDDKKMKSSTFARPWRN